jgi:tRNA modification GTPase
LGIASRIELVLDYPDDELDEETDIDSAAVAGAITDIEELLNTYSVGRIFQEGVRVAICGRTNAGKSSLFNLFLREDRSIVSDVHGTTRDYVESWINISGIPIALYDTAGLRDGSDELESEGIRRTTEVVKASDLILYLVDGTVGVSDEDEEFFDEPSNREKCIPVWSKIDRARSPAPTGYIGVSAVTGEGFHLLESAVSGRFLTGGLGGDGAVIDSQRQKRCLEAALDSLRHVKEGLEEGVSLDAVASDLRGALTAIGELAGEIYAADILESIFSQFCVGK